MPEQKTDRGLPVSGALFDQPFETPAVRFGHKGLDLTSAPDQVPPDAYRLLTNAVHTDDGQLVARPGLIDLTGHTDDIHSIRRLNDPNSSTFIRVWGVGTAVGYGATSITETEADFSGDPLTLVPYRPPLSSEPWMFIGDREKDRKMRADGLTLPIGLPAPTAVIAATVAPQETTLICQFDTSDASDGAAWTKNGGFDYADPPNPTAIPQTNDFASFNGNAIEFVANPSTSNAVFQAAKGYYSFWGLPRTLDLSVVGSQPADDLDLIHLWVKFSHPDLTAEFRLYLVLDEVFDPSILPGTSFEGINQNFYVKTWRQNDFAAFLQAQAAQIDAAETARVRAVRDQDLKNRAIDDTRDSWAIQRAAVDPARLISLQTGAGREQWIEYGVLGLPVRRGDFQRVGSDTTRTWATVTGIVIYIQTVDGTGGPVAVSLEDCYLAGGYGPDTAEPGAQPLDYRYTHYDPRTGAEGNPSPTMADGSFLDALRQKITLTPTPYGDSAVRQRFYRRGNSLTADWYFLGENDSDGGSFEDILTDAAIEAAGTVELDNDAFLTSVDANGDPVYGQPAPILFGPCQDLLFALGDPLRPGDVYYCKPGQPDSWPAGNHTEVTAPSEPLMNGGVFGSQAFCFSRERGYILYPNLTSSGTSVTATPTECRKGLAGRWAMAIGRGAIWFVGEDGIYRTTGGPEETISEPLRPLFHGQSVEGYSAVDFSEANEKFLRLEVHDFDLIFLYMGVDGAFHEFRYSILYQYWRPITRGGGIDLKAAYSDEGSSDLIYGGASVERAYLEGGTSDAGTAISVAIRPGYTDFGKPREDKRLGDLILDADRMGTSIFVTPRLNTDAVINATHEVADGVDRQRYILDPFGSEPQQARTMTIDLTWSTAGPSPIVYQWGVSLIPQPDVTLTRVTQWQEMPDEVYLTGLTLDVDTGGGAKTFYVEYDDADTENTWRTLGPYEVTHTKRHVTKFSWPVVKAKLFRIRPVGDCLPWQLFRADWIFDPEPPRIARWDINWENSWDQYVTGVDLECNTFGVTKTVEIWIDQTRYHTLPVTALGRRVVHLTVQPPRRGHILRFVATDDNNGLLYSHRWHADPEPSEQTNWNQNYSTWGYDSDKWLKALVFQCDTFAQNKNVTVEIDGSVVETLVVNADGRLVVEVALSQQRRGRVFRFLPVDSNPGRVYNITPVFDLEPLALTRWETQEITAGLPGWKVALGADLCLDAPAPVTLTVTALNQDGNTLVRQYLIPKTVGKQIPYVPFERSKGILYKFLLTSAQAFWLYREETTVTFVKWGTDQRSEVHVFGNDDQDATRGMGNSQLAAATPGGSLR